MRSIWEDLRFGARLLWKSPGFTLTALSILVVGIGASGAVFSLVWTLLLRPLPGVGDPERVVAVVSSTVSYPGYLDFRDAPGALSGLAAYRDRTMAVSAGGRTLLGRGDVVSGNYFQVLRARMLLGGMLPPVDAGREAPAVAVVSHRFWRQRLQGSPEAPGRSIRINGVPVQVVGVAAPGFRGTSLSVQPDLWAPIALWPRIAPASYARLDIHLWNWGWLSMVGRLAPGATLEQAEAALNLSARRQQETHPGYFPARYSVALRPVAVAAPGGPSGRRALEAFFGVLGMVVGLVLLIACANVASLQVARALHRRREMAVRRALGASAGRLLRQVLTESLLLALLAGGLSLAAVDFLGGLLGKFTLPGGIDLSAFASAPDRFLLGFLAALSLLTGVLFGLAPALQSLRIDPAADLKESPSPSGIRIRLRTLLLVAQVALSLVLLAGAGLFLRSLQRALRTDPGFRTEGVALASVDTGLARYDAARSGRFYAEAASRVAALPGVRRASWIALAPHTEDYNEETFTVEGYQPSAGERMVAEPNVAGPRFLEALAIPLKAGRGFGPGDVEGTLSVALVNETMARRYWPGGRAVGGHVDILGRTVTVVGVVGDIRAHDLRDPPGPQIYLPLAQAPAQAVVGPMTLLARTAGDPRRQLEPIRREIAAAGPEVPLSDLGTLEQRLAGLLAPQRMAASLLGWLSLFSTLIAAVGVYGLAAYEGLRRTREIGIRMAMGASRRSLLRLVLGRSLAWIALGIVLGIPLAVLLGRLAASFLYGVGAADPPTLAGTSLVLLAAGLVAALLPALRAAGTDPAAALRRE